jgi:hypothetical protein
MKHRNSWHTVKTGSYHIKIVPYPNDIRIGIIGKNDGVLIGICIDVGIPNLS